MITPSIGAGIRVVIKLQQDNFSVCTPANIVRIAHRLLLALCRQYKEQYAKWSRNIIVNDCYRESSRTSGFGTLLHSMLPFWLPENRRSGPINSSRSLSPHRYGTPNTNRLVTSRLL